jgi:uncharacterized membrane protein YqhA
MKKRLEGFFEYIIFNCETRVLEQPVYSSLVIALAIFYIGKVLEEVFTKKTVER